MCQSVVYFSDLTFSATCSCNLPPGGEVIEVPVCQIPTFPLATNPVLRVVGDNIDSCIIISVMVL